MRVEPRQGTYRSIQSKLATIPSKTGVYLLKDRNHNILYVGKAKELKNRLRSYFQKSSSLDARKTSMLRIVSDFEYTVTQNELEALVLEANLIKQFRPRFNILLRDDKNYPYLKLTLNERWPRLLVVRKIVKDGSEYFGPYVPSGAMWNILSFIRTHFHIPSCKYSLEKRMRPCIQYQIKKCQAPCAGLIDHKAYIAMIQDIRLLLSGKNKRLLKTLERKMQKLSGAMQYEEAAVIRDRIRAIEKISETQKAVAPGIGNVDVIGFYRGDGAVTFKILFSRNGVMIGSRDFLMKDGSDETEGYLLKNFIEQFYENKILPPAELLCPNAPEDLQILSSWLSGKKGSSVKISVPQRGMKRKLVEMAEENAREIFCAGEAASVKTVLEEIASCLSLNRIPDDIGAFDISNISGKESVGAFVYWKGGDFRKAKYRHIKMEAMKGPDDYAMMKEMVDRTLEHFERGMPDLVIIDGGKGHLELALNVFAEKGLTGNSVVAVAKDPDRVFLPGKGAPLNIEDGKPSSLLLKRIRDEVHRFAISYHKKLRSRKAFESPLEKIPGVGRKRRLELLRHFGSIEGIKNATIEDISEVKGFNRKMAARVSESLLRRQNG